MDLNIVWFILIVILFAGYAVLDGFDLGVGMNHLSAENDNDRRILLNSIGPLWDGNEVWLITAGGALFAAFPNAYATVFSAFYTAFMLFLLVLIGRGISIEFRSKVENPTWRKFWDYTFCICSYLLVVLLGVAFGNIIIGIPIDSHKEYLGTFFTLLRPYPIFVGITAVLVLRLHGILYIAMKTEGALHAHFVNKINLSVNLFIVAHLILTGWTLIAYPRMLENYSFPVWYIIPALVLLAIVYLGNQIRSRRFFRAFLASSFIIFGSIVSSAIGIFPNLVISSPEPFHSLDIYNSASSEKTLEIMGIIACFGVPLVLFYTYIINKIFRGKVKIDSHSY